MLRHHRTSKTVSARRRTADGTAPNPLTAAETIAAQAWHDAAAASGDPQLALYAELLLDLLEGAKDEFAGEVADWLTGLEEAEGRTAVYAVMDECVHIMQRWRRLPIRLRVAVLGRLVTRG